MKPRDILKRKYRSFIIRLSIFLIEQTRYGGSHFSLCLSNWSYNNILCPQERTLFVNRGTTISKKTITKMKVGSRISIQENCYIDATGGLEIGNDVSIGPGTYIFTTHHPYIQGGIIRNHKIVPRPVKIGCNIWIGAGVRILGGVTIGDRVVIGAGSVVTHDLNSNAIYAGVPAKLIKLLEK